VARAGQLHPTSHLLTASWAHGGSFCLRGGRDPRFVPVLGTRPSSWALRILSFLVTCLASGWPQLRGQGLVELWCRGLNLGGIWGRPGLLSGPSPRLTGG
jgi:hypothetical protein